MNYPENENKSSKKSINDNSFDLDPELSYKLKKAEFELRSSSDDNKIFTGKRILALLAPILFLILAMIFIYFLGKFFNSKNMH